MGIGRKLMPIPDSDGISAEDILAGVAGVLEHFVTAADAAMTEPAPTALDGDEDSSITIRDYLCAYQSPLLARSCSLSHLSTPVWPSRTHTHTPLPCVVLPACFHGPCGVADVTRH
jgi:hypothetical protein